MKLFFLIIIIISFNPAYVLSKKICDGKGNCMTEKEYNDYLNSEQYFCMYYPKYIWKESEREYGKNQYFYNKKDLAKIKSLKNEGVKKCEEGKIKEAELIIKKAIKIISFTRLK